MFIRKATDTWKQIKSDPSNPVPIDAKSLNWLYAQSVESGESPSKISAKDGRITAFTIRKKRFCTFESLHRGSLSLEEHNAFRKCVQKEFGIQPGGSFSKISTMALLQHKELSHLYTPRTIIAKGEQKQPQNAKDMRSAIYGPRGEVFRWKGASVEGLIDCDITGAFPKAASEELPCGDPLIDRSMKRYAEIAVQKAVVKVPSDLPIGPLPVRTRNHGLYFPVGCEIAGWWWDIELQMAEEYGCTVERERQWTFRSGTPLKGLMEKFIQLRQKYPNFRDLWKLVAVEAVGKLGMRPRKTEFAFEKENADLDGWYYVSPKHSLIARHVPTREKKFAKPSAYGYIQAKTRVWMYHFLMANIERIVSCHVDGVTLLGQKPPEQPHFIPTFRIKKTFPASFYFFPWSAARYIRGAAHVESHASGIGSFTPGLTEQKEVWHGFGPPTKINVPGPDKPRFRDRIWNEDGTTKTRS